MLRESRPPHMKTDEWAAQSKRDADKHRALVDLCGFVRDLARRQDWAEYPQCLIDAENTLYDKRTA